ncbi:hypothetical protein [Paenarthrobacter aromaticivorans]|uniref:Uncharacterized protein n=1 Tax=Paenarthrobacter aromaticivorans TaxID=2849150 RepID=A0ABS6I8S8_9MICC|nr:hypothetical protein [Paenarthrobacter sp. MMS21-TAE1-1]MBU8867835.1 hypothetical protein [Paenarthrobacter sp. MMS21-TAE1-1]
MTHAADLRAWALGVFTREAGTELLLRAFDGRLATPDLPWISTHDTVHGAWIDFDGIPAYADAYPGEEQAILRVAASLGGSASVVLGDWLAGLHCKHVQLVLAAVSHAAGIHEHWSGMSFNPDGTPDTMITNTALYPWPENDAQRD